MSEYVQVVESTLVSLQDAGRRSGLWVGIATNGATDQFSYRYSNALVGNRTDRPSLEVIMSDLVLRFDHHTVIAVSGATADIVVAGTPARMDQAILVPADSQVEIRNVRGGLRTYLSVVGGFVPEETFLGSVAPDRTLGFGLNLRPGTRVRCHERHLQGLDRREYPFPLLPHPPRPGHAAGTLNVLPGENQDQFDDNAAKLFHGEYVMTDKSDAVGSRLRGAVPRRRKTDEILSRALPIGSIEVAGNELLVLNRGRGPSAGYPVVGVVTAASMDELSQALPGSVLRFAPTSIEAARRQHLWQSELLTTVRERMTQILGSYQASGSANEFDPQRTFPAADAGASRTTTP